MWADETGASFAVDSAKIEGRSISYPVLLDANSEPMLEATNAFLEWYCAHCDIVHRLLGQMLGPPLLQGGRRRIPSFVTQ